MACDLLKSTENVSRINGSCLFEEYKLDVTHNQQTDFKACSMMVIEIVPILSHCFYNHILDLVRNKNGFLQTATD